MSSFEEVHLNHENHGFKLGYASLHGFCSTCEMFSISCPELLLSTATRMWCHTSCTEITGRARQQRVRMLVNFSLFYPSLSLDLVENLIFVKQVGFLCRPFPFLTLTQRFSSAPAKSGAASTFACNRHFGKKNTTEDWLTEKDCCHMKV